MRNCTLLPTFVCLNTWSLFLDISLCALLISRPSYKGRSYRINITENRSEDIVVFMSFVKKYVTAEILIAKCLTQHQYHNSGVLDCHILQAQEVMPMCISARRCC